MAEEFQIGGGSWWGSSRTRFEGGTTPSSSSGLISMSNSFGWPAEIMDLNYKAISSSNFTNSISASVSSSPMPFQDTRKLAQDPNSQMMGLGLSSHAMDWHQNNPRRGGEKAETRYLPGLQQNTSFAANFDQANEYKQFSTPNMSSSFQIDPAAYGSLSSTISSQGTVLGSDQNQHRPNFMYPTNNYGLNNPGELSPSLSKLPRYLRNSPPKQQSNSQLQFSNDAPSWNAASASMNDVRSSTFFSPPTFDDRPKNKSVVRDLGKVATKKSSSEASNKRSRSETSTSLPPFKVRKEKMGDRVTALQQLVSPFGKTDTASVLTEAIEYIKFLHEQVNGFDKPRDCKGPKQNLRSRGLCLVPVSSTFPITCETPVDYWSTPPYGATLR
ncbi:hypothetical protein RHSIM_RhsimUnG0255400 [Rhododendron simsii]|uniref:BHLH domain-containing protein n=1 Tax=Rhododendron simsii TaxID=118357 RepID=A0A834L3J5_RHOSS|nr:hypothetical protein RHSIM_RhsimUnG0255400 [Rhododendron simsii]